MLGTNAKGEIVVINEFDPLTGERSLQSIMAASPTTNVELKHEMQVAQEAQARAYDEGLTYTKYQVNDQKRQRKINKQNKELQDYNYKVMQYGRINQMNEVLKNNRENLSVEAAIRNFQQHPVDPSIMMDSGFKTVRAVGRAHAAPVTDYEKILQATAIGVDPVVIDHNPLGSIDFDQAEILDSREVGDEIVRLYKGQVLDVQDGDSINRRDDFQNEQGQESAMGARNQVQRFNNQMGFDFNFDQLWDKAEESLQTEAEKALQNVIAQSINPQTGKPQTAAPAVTTIVRPPTSSGGVNFLPGGLDPQTQKYILIGAAGLLGVAVLALVLKRK